MYLDVTNKLSSQSEKTLGHSLVQLKREPLYGRRSTRAHPRTQRNRAHALLLDTSVKSSRRASEKVYGADFQRNLHKFRRPVVLEWFRGQLCARESRKSKTLRAEGIGVVEGVQLSLSLSLSISLPFALSLSLSLSPFCSLSHSLSISLTLFCFLPVQSTRHTLSQTTIRLQQSKLHAAIRQCII